MRVLMLDLPKPLQRYRNNSEDVKVFHSIYHVQFLKIVQTIETII